jgi:hypothetical protein
MLFYPGGRSFAPGIRLDQYDQGVSFVSKLLIVCRRDWGGMS